MDSWEFKKSFQELSAALKRENYFTNLVQDRPQSVILFGFLALPIGRANLSVAIRRPSVRTSVNIFSLSHLLGWLTGRIFSKLVWDIPLMVQLCSPENSSGPSTNMAAGNYLWFSPLSHLLRNHWRNFVETLHIICPPKNDSGPSTNMAERQLFLKSLIALYLTLQQSRYRISSENTGRIDFLKLVWDVPPVV